MDLFENRHYSDFSSANLGAISDEHTHTQSKANTSAHTENVFVALRNLIS